MLILLLIVFAEHPENTQKTKTLIIIIGSERFIHSRAFTSAACLASHSLYLATVSTAHSKTSLPLPCSIRFKVGQGCIRFAGITGFDKTIDF